MKWITIEGAVGVPDDTDFDKFTDTFETAMGANGWQFFGIIKPPEEEADHV